MGGSRETATLADCTSQSREKARRFPDPNPAGARATQYTIVVTAQHRDIFKPLPTVESSVDARPSLGERVERSRMAGSCCIRPQFTFTQRGGSVRIVNVCFGEHSGVSTSRTSRWVRKVPILKSLFALLSTNFPDHRRAAIEQSFEGLHYPVMNLQATSVVAWRLHRLAITDRLVHLWEIDRTAFGDSCKTICQRQTSQMQAARR